jgi:hypothetical protein
VAILRAERNDETTPLTVERDDDPPTLSTWCTTTMTPSTANMHAPSDRLATVCPTTGPSTTAARPTPAIETADWFELTRAETRTTQARRLAGRRGRRPPCHPRGAPGADEPPLRRLKTSEGAEGGNRARQAYRRVK